MNRSLGTLGAVLALALAAGAAGPAAAEGESPTAAWGAVQGFSSPDRRAIILNEAIASEIARKGGYGPGHSYSETHIENQTINSTHNGPEVSSSSTQIVNSNSVENRTTVGSNNSGFQITASTGASQYSGTATQSGTAQATATWEGSSASVDANTSSN